jgi:hypothetical protein
LYKKFNFIGEYEMNAIKTILIFLWGGLMASAIWIMVIFPIKIDDTGMIINNFGTAIVSILFGALLIFLIVFSINWLVCHWNDK